MPKRNPTPSGTSNPQTESEMHLSSSLKPFFTMTSAVWLGLHKKKTGLMIQLVIELI
jgi:hypothetical protein